MALTAVAFCKNGVEERGPKTLVGSDVGLPGLRDGDTMQIAVPYAVPRNGRALDVWNVTPKSDFRHVISVGLSFRYAVTMRGMGDV